MVHLLLPKAEMSTATELQIDADQLEVSRIRALRGPNYWRLAPVIACDVELGSLEQISSADIPGFYERLTEAIPTLAEHHCTRQEPGGFLERLREGTHIPHILEHVALELQSLAGTDVSFGRVVPSGDPDTWWVIVAYEEEEVGLQAMRDAVKVVRACIADRPIDVNGIIEQLLSLYETVRLGPSTAAVVEEAKRRGISGRIDNEDALKAAWNDAREFGDRIVIEQYAAGRDHRVLVINGKVVACAERIPARVVGDGSSTIAQLIEKENRDPRRGIGHTKTLTKLPADERTVAFLAKQNLTLQSVPARNQSVFLRGTANLSTGGTAVDRTDEMHPDNITACEMAAGIIGLDIAGIDVLTPDISVPFRENNAVIIEVNAGPGIRMHTHPAEGKPRNVGAPIIDMLYPPGTKATIPVIAVTGTNGKTTTVRLIAHLFRLGENVVGFTTTDGTYLQNRMVMEGDMTGPFSANIILSNPTVDIAVLETARGGLLRAGLGFDEVDVGVVLNVSAYHLGLRGINTLEQLADVKGVVAAVVKREGHAVLNADDPLVYAMRERTPGDLVLFSTRPEGESEEFEAHLTRNGIGARIENDTFVIRRGRLRIPIAPVREVPLMVGGAARFQQENILAAVATAYVQGMRYDDIRAGLLSFFPSPSLTPGRLNLIRVKNGRVLVDYAHNPTAIRGLIDFARNVDANRRICLVAAPGDRRDKDLREVGRIASQLDYVIVKEDKDLRGREKGSVAELIIDGLMEGGMEENQFQTIHDEREAIGYALDQMKDNDLVVILADRVSETLDTIREYSSR